MPTSRALATQLGIGRNIVVEAYSNLVTEGLLIARGRNGTFVALNIRSVVTNKRSTQPILLRRLQTSPNESEQVRSKALNWRMGQANTRLLPLAVWRSACREAGRHVLPEGYGHPQGDPQLRQSLALWLRTKRSLPIDAERIVITAGAGQAIDLLARILVAPGDRCAVEDPGYPRVVAALKRAGARVETLAVDRLGACVETLTKAKHFPQLIHLTAAHQHPMGGRLSAQRRQWILDAAQRNHALIIENEYDHEFVHEGQRFAPMAATSPAHCILVGTFARAISPALRLGYVVAPSEVIASLANAIAADQLQAAWPVQLSANWLLRSGEMERHLRRVGKHYARIRLELKTQLQSLAPLVTIRGDEGGLHIVLDCAALSAAKFTELNKRLHAQGVIFDTINRFVVERAAPRVLLIGYGHLDLAEIKRSCKVLIKTFASLR